MTYTYYTVTGKVVDGEIVVNLKGRQVKLYGSNFVLVAVKTIEGLRTRNVLRCSLMKKGTPMYKATATIYVVSRNDSVLNFSDLQVGSELTSDVSRQELLDVKQQIEQTGCPILGTVLNQVDYDNYMGRKYYKSYSKYGKYGYYRKYYKRSCEAEKK